MTIDSIVNKIQISSGSTITITNLNVTTSSQVVITLLLADGTETLLVENSSSGYTINEDLDTVTLENEIDSTIFLKATATVSIEETQTSDYVNINPHNTEVTEADLDKMTLKLKQLQEKLDRAIAAPISTASGSFDLPNLDGEAGKYMKLNSTEDGFEFQDVETISFWDDYTLPSGDGEANQVLETDGSSTLSWTHITGLPTMNVEASTTYQQITDNVVASDNITSIVDVTNGTFVVNFTTPMTSLGYGFIINTQVAGFPSLGMETPGTTKTTSTISINTYKFSSGSFSSTDVVSDIIFYTLND